MLYEWVLTITMISMYLQNHFYVISLQICREKWIWFFTAATTMMFGLHRCVGHPLPCVDTPWPFPERQFLAMCPGCPQEKHLHVAIAAKDTPSFILPPSVFLFLTLSFSLSQEYIYLQTDMREAHAITVIAIHPNCTCVCRRWSRYGLHSGVLH